MASIGLPDDIIRDTVEELGGVRDGSLEGCLPSEAIKTAAPEVEPVLDGPAAAALASAMCGRLLRYVVAGIDEQALVRAVQNSARDVTTEVAFCLREGGAPEAMLAAASAIAPTVQADQPSAAQASSVAAIEASERVASVAAENASLLERYTDVPNWEVPGQDRTSLALALCGVDVLRAVSLDIEATSEGCTAQELMPAKTDVRDRAMQALLSAEQPPCFECDRSPAMDAMDAIQLFADVLRLGGEVEPLVVTRLDLALAENIRAIIQLWDRNLGLTARVGFNTGDRAKVSDGEADIRALADDHKMVGLIHMANRLWWWADALVDQAGHKDGKYVRLPPFQYVAMVPRQSESSQMKEERPSADDASCRVVASRAASLQDHIIAAVTSTLACSPSEGWEPYQASDCRAVREKGDAMTSTLVLFRAQCRDRSSNMMACEADLWCDARSSNDVRCKRVSPTPGAVAESAECIKYLHQLVGKSAHIPR